MVSRQGRTAAVAVELAILFWWLTIGFTVLLLVLGNVVTTTGSGMGCGEDWPGCNGQWIPDLSNFHVLYEFGHRVLAALVGVLTVLAATFAWRVEHDRLRPALRAATGAAVLLLLLQVVLGALAVRFVIPPSLVFVHLGVSMAFLAMSIAALTLAKEASSSRLANPTSLWKTLRHRPVLLWGAVAIYAQILLGAYVRHGGAGLACPDVPLCQGQLIPAFNPATWIHLLHRLGALVVAGLVWGAFFQARRGVLPDEVVRATGWGAGLVVVQLILGGLSVLSLLDPLWTSLHLLAASVLLAIWVGVVMRVWLLQTGEAKVG